MNNLLILHGLQDSYALKINFWWLKFVMFFVTLLYKFFQMIFIFILDQILLLISIFKSVCLMWEFWKWYLAHYNTYLVNKSNTKIFLQILSSQSRMPFEKNCNFFFMNHKRACVSAKVQFVYVSICSKHFEKLQHAISFRLATYFLHHYIKSFINKLRVQRL